MNCGMLLIPNRAKPDQIVQNDHTIDTPLGINGQIYLSVEVTRCSFDSLDEFG